MQEVIPGLFVGNLAAADRLNLRKKGIQAMVSVCDADLLPVDPPVERWIGATVSDEGEPDGTDASSALTFREHLERAVPFVLAALAESKKTLVHCVCGQNRSVATVAACLMILRPTWDLNEAIMAVRRARPIAGRCTPELRRAVAEFAYEHRSAT
jgi:protein-tyrosine phosphatase